VFSRFFRPKPRAELWKDPKSYIDILEKGEPAFLRELVLLGAPLSARAGLAHPLWYAGRSENSQDSQGLEERLKILLRAGADPLSPFTAQEGSGGQSLLTRACFEGKLGLIQALFRFLPQRRAELVGHSDGKGFTPWQVARALGQSQVLEFLESVGGENPRPAKLENIERLAIQGRPVIAEIHEQIKFALRTEGMELLEVQVPNPETVRYFLPAGQLELTVVAGSSLNLIFWKGGEPLDLLSGLRNAKLDSRSLREALLIAFHRLVHDEAEERGNPSWNGVNGVSEAGSAWEILGISKGASKEEINRAYRKMALRYHPDLAGPDEEARALREKQMKAINQAKEKLD
jgi:hypothetical protein